MNTNLSKQEGKSEDIIIFGEGGTWFKRNSVSLKKRFPKMVAVGETGWESTAKDSKASIALIMTPPDTHKPICELLMKNEAIEKIYCEKPFPDIEKCGFTDDEKCEFRKKIRVIDHYLLKKPKPSTVFSNIIFGKNKTWRLAQRYLGQWFYSSSAAKFVFAKTYGANKKQDSLPAITVLATFLLRYLTRFTGWVPVKYLEIDIEETDDESRFWMFSEDHQGGVVLDLGHHALAILLRIFDEKTLKNSAGKKLTIMDVEYFTDQDVKRCRDHGDCSDPIVNYAIKKIRYVLELGACSVQISLAKSADLTSKRIALFRRFMTHAKSNKEYSLIAGARTGKQTGYDYSEIFAEDGNSAACLTYSEVCTINAISNRVIGMAQKRNVVVRNSIGLGLMSSIDLINNLSDQFKYRHSFYWQSYYKLVIYQILILVAPYLFVMNLPSSVPDNIILNSGIIVLTLVICIWVYVWGVQNVSAVLAEEHIRTKVVHDRLKELLLKLDVDLDVVSLNENSISDVMLTQYRVLIRGFCILNPIFIYVVVVGGVDSIVEVISDFLSFVI